jgi:hypothetical protein
MHGRGLLANTGGICGFTIALMRWRDFDYLEHMRDNDSAQQATPTIATSFLDEGVGGVDSCR